MNTTKLFLKSLVGTLVFLTILFVCAGRITYWQGWLYASLNLLFLVINSFALRSNEELAGERSATKTDTKAWDKKILGISAITLILTYGVAGLDAGRFSWSPLFTWYIAAVGVVFMFLGELLFISAQRQNKFFSSVMRIQTDRGHTVCDTGVYRIVRHPAYLGMILTATGIPLILGSLWSLIPSAISMVLTLIRTSLEDKTLILELPGYQEYTLKTRYKLIPGLY